MGHGFCQWNQGLCIALAACLVLCLGPGAEAIKCKQCNAKKSEICHSHKKTCKSVQDGAVCLVQRKYKGGHLMQMIMTCSVDKQTCGAQVEIPDEGYMQQTDCCADRDFCSNDI